MPTLPGHIIVVDDDQGVRNSLKFVLSTHGLSVDTYGSGQDLLDRASFPDDACFILDYLMPDIDGIALLGKLREREIASPAILVTPQIRPQLREKALKSGFSMVIEKPFEDERLLDSIRSALQVR